MRLLWISDSPQTPSGFAAVTRAVCGRLASRGHELEILGWQDHWRTSDWEGIPVRPVRWDAFGSDVLLSYLLRFRPDFIITLGDPWWLGFMTDPPVQRFLDASGTRWLLYYPVDGADAEGRLPSAWCRVLEAADIPVAMSRFGQAVSARSGVRSAYLPHGCDLDIFAPPADKAAAKAALGYDGAFVILSDARNQPRKLLPRMLDIVAEFARGKPDVIVHVHADPDDDAASSDLYRYRLREDVAVMGLADTVRLTENFKMRSLGGLPVAELARIYEAADAHLLCSWGEGFGLPNLQAAATGVVPIAGAYSASEELVAGHGFAIPIESSVTDEFGLRRCLISRDAAVAALERLYRDPAELADRSRRSREFAEGYAWDAIADGWDALLRRAAPRRPPRDARTMEWVARGEAPSDVPEPIAAAADSAFGSLPGGVRVTLRMTERVHGETAARIQREAFVDGDELSIPVRLASAAAGARRARVGALLIAPADMPLARRAERLFPDLTLVSLADVDPGDLLGLLPQFCLVIDLAGSYVAAGLDLACATLGVPYLGPSTLWPEVDERSPLRRLRRLLTDQGLSESRRRAAGKRARAVAGAAAVAAMQRQAAQGVPAARAIGAPVG